MEHSLNYWFLLLRMIIEKPDCQFTESKQLIIKGICQAKALVEGTIDLNGVDNDCFRLVAGLAKKGASFLKFLNVEQINNTDAKIYLSIYFKLNI